MYACLNKYFIYNSCIRMSYSTGTGILKNFGKKKKIEQRRFWTIYSHNDRHLFKYDNNKITEYIVEVRFTEKGVVLAS